MFTPGILQRHAWRIGYSLGCGYQKTWLVSLLPASTRLNSWLTSSYPLLHLFYPILSTCSNRCITFNGASEWQVVNLGGFFEVRIAGPAADLDGSPGRTGTSGADLGAWGLARQQHQLGFRAAGSSGDDETTEMLEREGPHRTEMTCWECVNLAWFSWFKGFKGPVILTSFAKAVSKLRLSSWSSVTWCRC